MLPTMDYGLCSGCDIESHLTFNLILLICKLQSREFIQYVVGENPWKEAVCTDCSVNRGWNAAGPQAKPIISVYYTNLTLPTNREV